MKWRHWSILIILLLLNYIIFSAALTRLTGRPRPPVRPTHTPWPTFERIEATPVAWIILPTSTPLPTHPPVTPGPAVPSAPTESPVPSQVGPEAGPVPAPTGSPSSPSAPTETAEPTRLPPTATPTGSPVVHTVKSGETLSGIAGRYGVSVQAIAAANGLANPNLIITGQQLIIPAPGQGVPTATQPAATSRPTATRPPAATPTRTPTPTATAVGWQFTGQVVWDPRVAPNCSGPAISRESRVTDTAGNPVNGVRIEVNCYGNRFLSHPSGHPGEYDPGHYDFSFGQSTPQDWTCTARVVEFDGQPVTSSQVITIHFDTNDCRPEGAGHQVAIVNWVKQW